MLHEEGERVARFSTTKTFEGVSDRVNYEARCALVMERAASCIVVAFLFEGDKIGEDVVDVDGFFYGGGVLDHG